jgi:hypothetical protein
VKVDLNAASNMFGVLGGSTRMRLMAVLSDPTPETWDDAYTILLNGDRLVTLWQAVLAVDPGFASAKAPVTRWVDDDSELGGHSEPVSGWSRVPTAEIIQQAIGYATR